MPSAAAALRARLESSLGEQLSSTLMLRGRAAPQMVSMGAAQLDVLTGGLPRGALSEIVGPASSGRTGVMLAALAEATKRQEFCALVDAGDSFDPASAAAAGVDLERLLWVRCGERGEPFPPKQRRATGGSRDSAFTSIQSGSRARAALRQAEEKNPGLRATNKFAFREVLEQVLKVTDLLLQSGGFGMVVLDLGDVPPESARRVPMTSWFRFRRVVEPTPTVLLLVEREPCAKTCASLVLRLERESLCVRTAVSQAETLGWRIVGDEAVVPENNPVSHASLLTGIRLWAEVLRHSFITAGAKKPVQGVGASFELGLIS